MNLREDLNRIKEDVLFAMDLLSLLKTKETNEIT